MPPTELSLEKKLDRDFLRYLLLTKTLFDKIVSDDDRTLCEAWLKRLCGKCITTISGKRDRNIYLSRLLLQMQDGKLKDIFLSAPPAELESPYTVFGLPREVEDIKGFKEFGFQLDNDAAGGSGDFSESSRDGRTYLATRQIKNGMMAYLAVTVTEDEPLWLPQQARPVKPDLTEIGKDAKPSGGGRFIKKLAQYECVPLTQLRRSPEERDRVLEWMDKIIDDCNKWLRGEDPHNADLETLFELRYQDYEEDPEKAEILEYPKDVRDVLMRDIRQIIKERRAEVSRRELILDQYEADEYVEEKYPPAELDAVWRQCAKRPMKDYIKKSLDKTYPADVVESNRQVLWSNSGPNQIHATNTHQLMESPDITPTELSKGRSTTLWFFELLVQERIMIIEKGEREANRKINEMKKSNVEELKRELQRVAKLKQDYKDYYCIYKEAEEYDTEYRNNLKESEEGKVDKGADKKQDMTKLKGELEDEIIMYRDRYEQERKTQGELVEALEEAKEAYCNLRERLKREEDKLICQKDVLLGEKQKLKELIDSQRKRLCDLRNQVKMKEMGGAVCDDR